jgi:DNA-binding LytR/AlgR family response regulator
MMRTMITETPFEQTWVLQGKLCGQWALELERKWTETKNSRQGRKCVVNLEDITWVDVEGEKVLRQILKEGVQVIASRAYMKHVVESLDV